MNLCVRRRSRDFASNAVYVQRYRLLTFDITLRFQCAGGDGARKWKARRLHLIQLNVLFHTDTEKHNAAVFHCERIHESIPDK